MISEADAGTHTFPSKSDTLDTRERASGGQFCAIFDAKLIQAKPAQQRNSSDRIMPNNCGPRASAHARLQWLYLCLPSCMRRLMHEV